MAQPQELPFGHVSLSHVSSKAASRPWQLSLSLSPERTFLFFGLIVLYDGPEGNDQIAAEIAQRIQGTIQYHHQVLTGHNVSLTHEDLFEQCLQKINSELNVFLRDVQVALPVHRWAMSIGMLATDSSPDHWQVFLSRFGDVSAWLLHKAQLDTYKLISIFDTPDPITGSPGAQKYFKNIVSSSLAKQDQLLFCTPNIFNYISLSDTKKILVELSAKSAMRQLQNILQDHLQDPVAAALTIKLSPYKQIDTPQAAPVTHANEAAHSMKELIQTQSQTERILGTGSSFSIAQVSTAAKRVLDSMVGSSPKTAKSSGQARSPRSVAPGKVQAVFSAVQSVTAPLLQKIQSWRDRKPANTPMGKSDYVAIHGTISRVSQWRTAVSRYITPVLRGIQWKNLARSPKFIGVIVLVIVLGLGLHRFYTKKQAYAATVANAETNLQTVKTALDRIDSYLIVGREADAVVLTQQAKDTLAMVGDDLEQYAEQKQAYATKIEDQQRRLRKEIPVSGAIALIEDLTTRLNSPARYLLKEEDSLLIVGTDPHTVIDYRISNKDARSQSVSTDITQSDSTTRTATNLYVRGGNTMASINIARGTSSPATTINNQSGLTAITEYNNRIYALSPSEGQIQRSNGLPNFSVFSPWLDQADMDLSQAVDLAIDGSIFVLTRSGMNQYAQNVRVNSFKIDAIEPALANAQALSYEADNQHFFILEGQRLLVYKKTGKFVAQYILSNEEQPVDIAVDEAKSIAYVLTTETLLSFPIQLGQ